MKKVLIINNDLKSGGVQKALINLVNEIHSLYHVTLLLFNNSDSLMDELPEDVCIQTVNSWFCYLGKSQSECKGIDYLIRGGLAFITKRFGRQHAMRLILHTQKKLPEIYDVGISYLHNGDPNSFYGGCNDFLVHCVTANKKIAFLHCDYENSGANVHSNNVLYDSVDVIAACSKGCKKAFLKCLPQYANKTVVVPNCHNYKQIKQKSIEEDVPFSTSQINILTVARLTKEKGVDRGIIAVANCCKKGIEVMYHIVGDGVQNKQLKTLAESLGIQNRIVFWGEDKNPYKYMRKADLLLISSYHEAAPMVIGEATALGLPVLSTRTTSSVEMVQEQNVGWVVDNNQDAINEKLFDICSDRTTITEFKKYLTERQFSNAKAVGQFKDMLEK